MFVMFFLLCVGKQASRSFENVEIYTQETFVSNSTNKS